MKPNIKRFFWLAILSLLPLSCKNLDIPEDGGRYYAKGADIGWVTEMEDKGYKFYTPDYSETELTSLLKSSGFNAVRHRVWVNPTVGYCDKEDLLVKTRRARLLGMKIMVDFHYSDWWADPQKQNIPEAWKGFSAERMAQAVADHTCEVLSYLKDNGIDVEWVQVGNEVRTGMLWDVCKVKGQDADNFTLCFNAGAAMVKKVYPDAKVILHLDNAYDLATLQWFYDLVGKTGARYDIIGLSLYPSYWDEATRAYPDWQPKTSEAVKNFSILHERYGKDVMLVEFGMPVSQPTKAAAALTYLMEKTESMEWFGGIFFWEPEAESARNGYDYGAFSNGKPTIALDPFKQ